jgi:hypothetical protein
VRARPSAGEVLPAAGEAFLREHRYRGVVRSLDKPKTAREISKLGQGLPPDMMNADENAMQIL